MTSSALTQRQDQTLHLLARFRFLTRAQVEAFLFPPGSEITPGSRTVMAKRVLTSLKKRDLVRHAVRGVGGPRGGSSPHVWYLTPKGARAMNTEQSIGPRRRAPRGGFLAAHATTVADVALAFRNAARQQPGHELAEFLCDWEIRQQFDNAAIVPDAFLIYASSAIEVSAFVEVDLGTEGMKFFTKKVERYLDFRRSGAWEKPYGVWPVVLVVAPTRARTTLLKAAAERVLDARPQEAGVTEFLFAAIGTLRERGPLGDIWQMAGADDPQTLL